MSVFIGNKNKRVELAERKDAINPNLFTGSKDFTGNWLNVDQVKQKDKYLDFTTVYVDWAWNGISQYIDAKKDEVFTFSAYVKAKAGSSLAWYIVLNTDNEGGHTKAGTSEDGVPITTTGDWQRVSTTFTVTSDGTIKPRIESVDSTSPFWIAGMKLEKGPVATDWCPAYDDYASNSGFNSKVNVDGPLYKDLTQFNNWSDLFDDYAHSKTTAALGRLVAFRDDTNGSNTIGDNGSGIAFGGGDTSGVLSVSYEWNNARITAGNGTSPIWHEDIAWKSDITNLQNQITPLQTQLNDAVSEINYLKTNMLIGKHFTDEASAQTWENANPNGIAFIDK